MDKNIGRLLDCRIISSDTQFADLLPEWELLWHRAGRPVFAAPAWTEAWWTCIGRARGVRLAIVTVRHDDRLIAVLPWCIARRHGILRILEWCGWQDVDKRGPLIDPTEDADPLLDAARAEVWRAGGFDLAYFRQVTPDDPFARWAARHMRALPLTTEIYEFSGSESTPDTFLAGLKSHHRTAYRRSVREIAKKRGGAMLRVFSSTEDAAHALSRLLDIKQRWAAGKGHRAESAGVASNRVFFERLVPALMRAGCARVSALLDDDGVMLAGGIVLEQGDTLMTYLTGFDADAGIHSPGTVFQIDMIRWGLENGYTRLDFLRGNYDYKRQLASGSYYLLSFVGGRTPLGWAARRLINHGQRNTAAPAEEPASAA